MKIKMHQIAMFGLMIRVFGLIVGLGTSILLARVLGPEQFGQYGFLLTIAELFTIVALFGTPTLLTREVAAGIATHSYGKVRGLLIWTGKTTTIVGIPMMLCALAAIFYWQQKQIHPISVSVLLIPTSFILIDAFSRQRTNVIQGLNKIVASQALSIIISPGCFLILLVGLYCFFPNYISLNIVFFLLLASRLLALVIIERKKKSFLPEEMLKFSPEFYSKKWLDSALPLLLVGSLLIVNTRIDIVMLGYLREAGEVGIYRVAQRGGEFMLFGVMAVDSIINPLAAKAWAQNQKQHLQTVVSKSILFVLLFTLPLLCIFVVFGKEIITFVYGQSYSLAWLPLVILSCGYLSLVLLGRGGVILTMSHFERDTAKAIGIGVGANIILNLCLIPQYGINGAALATALAVTMRMVMEALFAYRKTGINTTIFSLVMNKQKS